MAMDNQQMKTGDPMRPQVFGRGYILDEYVDPNLMSGITGLPQKSVSGIQNPPILMPSGGQFKPQSNLMSAMTGLQQKTLSGIQNTPIMMPYGSQFKAQSNQSIQRKKSQQINYYPAQMMQEQCYYPAQQAANSYTVQSRDTRQNYNNPQEDYDCGCQQQEQNNIPSGDEGLFMEPEPPQNECFCQQPEANECSCQLPQQNDFSCSIKIEQNNADGSYPIQDQNDYLLVSLQQNTDRCMSSQEGGECNCSQQNDFIAGTQQQNDYPITMPPPTQSQNCYTQPQLEQNDYISSPSPAQQNNYSAENGSAQPQKNDSYSQQQMANSSRQKTNNASNVPSLGIPRKGVCCESQMQPTDCCATEAQPNSCCATCCSSYEVQTTKIQVQQNEENLPQQYSQGSLHKDPSRTTENLYSNKNFGNNNCDCRP